jgi:hypothetical protein
MPRSVERSVKGRLPSFRPTGGGGALDYRESGWCLWGRQKTKVLDQSSPSLIQHETLPFVSMELVSRVIRKQRERQIKKGCRIKGGRSFDPTKTNEGP